MICLVWGAGIVCLLCVLFGMMHLVWGVMHKVVDMVCLVWNNYIVVVIMYLVWFLVLFLISMWRISYGCLVWGVKHGVLGMGYMVLGVWCGVCGI